ncbi:Cytochrome P450 4c3 [Orchesella cincta]|uniref:Cytochrome P450 4c3 n=1 Tax=Orchesella cincta TaxID=48709 RepID=A0A1D2MY62_ORCCI|nr:Cytochrome P450 4c3 [Orchesella cincta]
MKGVDGIKGSGNSDFVSMIEVMLENGVTDKEIFEEVAITLAVAHDTTSVAMQIALFLLALHPDHQEICRAEADELFSDPTKYNDGNLQFSALPELKHLERCILESSRMLSLASILMRKLDAPLQLQEGLVIPAGVSIYVFPPVIHKNPEYFPNPEKFDPDRFLPEPSKQRHKYAFLSFAAGPRNCIGTKLAIIEIKMMIAKILHKFVVTTPDKYEDVVIIPSVIPGPEKPIRFIFKRRNDTN